MKCSAKKRNVNTRNLSALLVKCNYQKELPKANLTPGVLFNSEI